MLPKPPALQASAFFASRDRKTIQTSLAQIFNELGKGIILRGEEVELKKNDRTPHLSAEQAFNLMSISLKEYYEAVKNLSEASCIA
ncbi:MAG: hypothetical protein WDN26_16675 [Chitinophagaceae bacterium]